MLSLLSLRWSICMYIFTDSLNAYQMVMNTLNKPRTRTIEHVDGVAMAADGLAKPLQREKHDGFVRLLGMASKKIPWAKD